MPPQDAAARIASWWANSEGPNRYAGDAMKTRGALEGVHKAAPDRRTPDDGSRPDEPPQSRLPPLRFVRERRHGERRLKQPASPPLINARTGRALVQSNGFRYDALPFRRRR